MPRQDPTVAALCSILRGDVSQPNPIRPQSLANAALAHGVHNLIFEQCAGRDDDNLRQARSLLRDTVHRSVSQLLAQNAASRELCQDLANCHFRFLPIKGLAVAHSDYPSPHLRPRADTDILVDPEQVAECRTWLQQNGYRCEPLVVPLSKGMYLASQFGATREAGQLFTHTFDIHWRVSNRACLSEPLDFELLYSSSVPAPSMGEAMRVPHPLYSLIIACVHWIAEPSKRLIWLYDIHLMASAMSADFADTLQRSAREMRLSHIIHHVLRQTQEAFHSRLPAELLQALQRTMKADPQEPTRLLISRPDKTMAMHRADFLALADAATRIRMLGALLFPPPSYLDLAGIGHGLPLPLRHTLRLTRPLWRRFGRRAPGRRQAV